MQEIFIRQKCAVNGAELEPLSSYDFPLFCGCTDEAQEKDYILKQEWAISKDGVIELTKLVPLDLLYQNGHEAGTTGALWEAHHKEFAEFLMEEKPKNVLEIGGGHGKLSQLCLALGKVKWSIVEPNSPQKYDNISYIDGFFRKELVKGGEYDCIVHSHTFEHIYEPNEFLNEIASVLTGGGGLWFLPCQICKNGWKTNSQTALISNTPYF